MVLDATGGPSLGLLVPRIALTAINAAAPVTSPATSLLVYNTATANTGTLAVSPGYYYWDAAKWVRFQYVASGTSSLDWSLIGNAGTTASTNFIGTTDLKPFSTRVNNILRFTIDTNSSIIYRPFNVRDTTTLSTGAFSTVSFVNRPSSSTLPYYARHNQMLSTKRVKSGDIDNGYSIGLWLQNFRGLNDGFQTNLTDNDGGTLASLTGIVLQYGHHNYGKSIAGMGSAITNDCIGLGIYPYGTYGTINNAYDLYITPVNISSNHFAIYADGASKKSYFAGNVGIGTTTPAAKLSIVATATNTGFQLQDGSEGAGKVLTSDATGKASWQTPISSNVIIGVMPNPTTTTALIAGNNNFYSGVSFNLSAGVWELDYQNWAEISVVPNTGFFYCQLSTSNTLLIPPASFSANKTCLTMPYFNDATSLGGTTRVVNGKWMITVPVGGQTIYIWNGVNVSTTCNGTFQNNLIGSAGPYSYCWAKKII